MLTARSQSPASAAILRMKKTLIARVAVLALVIFVASAAWAASFKVGDKVEAWNVTWYPATVVKAGSGSYAGYYFVHYDSGTDQWIRASNIRARPGSRRDVVNAASSSGPRAGKYICMGYNGGAGMFRWYLYLGGGAYRQRTPDLPGGSYTYNLAQQRLSFTSGPYKADNWIGLFSVERDGKTHKVVLRDRAKQTQGPRVGEYSNIYCTNSTDS
jgi:hypothetical protein